MQIRIFTIPVGDDGVFQSEMNAFLSGHRVLEIEQKFFQNGGGGYWSFCVRYISGGLPPPQGGQHGYQRGQKVDYREVLNEKDFTVFSKLRVIRKELAAADGAPSYVVFTDEELANIARLPELTEKAILGIPGIGEKKAAKYGKVMIEKYNALAAASAGTDTNTDANTNTDTRASADAGAGVNEGGGAAK